MAISSLGFPVGMNHFKFVSKPTPGNEPKHLRDLQREALAEKAVKVGAEYMMWVDDDTIPPPTAIQELFFVLSQHPEAAICGGIYCTKQIPPSPIVFKELGAGPFWHWTLGEVFECKGLGTGCMMVRTSIMKDIPKPWFKDTSESYLGETENFNGVEVKITGRTGTDDTYFCKKVSDAGHIILAHGGILPVHVDYNDNNKGYKLPENSYPVLSYKAQFEKDKE